MCDRIAIGSLQTQTSILGSGRTKVNEDRARRPAREARESRRSSHSRRKMPAKRSRLCGIGPQSRVIFLTVSRRT